MGDYKRLASLVLIMVGVCLIVGATAIGVIYEAALDRERARLVNIAQSQARLMEALARFEAPATTEGGPATADKLAQILEANRRLREPVIGHTAELQLARRDGDLMVFVTPARGSDQPHNPVIFGGAAAEAMTAALSGRSGTMIGRDYAGRRVLAAFEPVHDLGLGLVAKIDMAEINGRYLRAGAIVGLASLAAVAGAVLLFFRVGEPMVRRLRESESRYRELFDNMEIGVAVFHARSREGGFVFKDLNRAGERIAQIKLRNLLGGPLTQTFPGAREFGLIDALTRVWQTGQAERLPTRYYRDERIEGWRDVYIYRLPSGEVVTLFSDVSARERQAEALRQSEQRYRNLVEAQPDLICQFLPDTTLTFVNRAYAEFYGTQPEELMGKRWLDFAAKDDRPRFLEELSSFTPEHPERHEETRSTRADGEVRWYLCHLYGFFDDAGNILSFQTFGTDITARKRSEEQLAQQLGLLAAITDSAADAIFVTDREGRVTLMNPAAERIFGWSREELSGRKLHHAIHDRYPDGRPYPPSECPLNRVYLTGETLVRHEDVFFRKDRSPIQVACSNAPLVIEGRIAGSVLVAHDISERKRTEAALHESEARYRTAGEAIRYGVWVCNPQGGVEFVSQTFLDLIGKTLDEVRPRGWLDRLPSEDLKPTLHAWRECVRTGSEWTWEHRVKGKDGLYRTILSLGRPVRDEAHRITSWVGFNLDISARREAEDALRESEARFRGTFENAAVGIANVGVDGAWLRVNQRLCDIVGHSRDELLKKKFQEMTHSEDLPFNLERFTALMRGEIDTYQLEKRFIHKDGHAVWVNLTTAVQRDHAGNLAYCIAIIEDVSDRKRSEQALRESEARLRRTVEYAPFPIMVHAEDGEVVHVSQTWLTLTGYAREEIATIAAWTERAYGERKDMVRAEIDRLYHIDEALDEGEYVIRTANGGARVWAFSSAPLGSDSHGRRLVVSMAADVTDRKAAERALSESEIRMRALLDARVAVDATCRTIAIRS